MGKQASVQRLSAIRLPIQLVLLLLFVPAAVVGCRGPWFQKTDKFDSLLVTEKPEARTPRGFASRLRPSPGENARTAAPRPDRPSRSISDNADEDAGDDLPSESQELFRRQMQALKNMRADATEDLLVKKQADSANFSMSDDSESASFDQPPATPLAQNPVNDSQKTKQKTAADDKIADEKINEPVTRHSPKDANTSHPLSKEGLRNSRNQPVPGTSPTKPEQNATAQSIPTQATDAPASDSPPVESVVAISAKTVKIETAKSDWRVLASETLAALRSESDGTVALSPDQKLSIEAKKRLLSLILDDLDAAMTPIGSLQPQEQEFFQHEFQALHAATDPKGNPVLNRRWTLALQSHRKAQMNLAAVSNLEIQNATFCTEVDSFGIISKFPQYHFRKDQELLLYCELDNFVSTPVKDGFETQLQGSYEIVDSNGRRVADQLLPMDEHVCRNQRRDYFIAYRMYMPQDVKPGRYTLKLTIEDMKGRKFGQTNVEFQIIQ